MSDLASPFAILGRLRHSFPRQQDYQGLAKDEHHRITQQTKKDQDNNGII